MNQDHPNIDPEETFLARWLSGDLSEEERQQLPGREEELRAYRRLVEMTDRLAAPEPDLDASWQAIQRAQQKTTTVRPMRRLGWWSAAASVLLLVVAVWWWSSRSGPQQIATAAGEQETIELPAGSRVVLGSASQLSYDPNSWSENRQLQLSGHAYFEVTKGQAFEVQTNRSQVRVLGTAFEVYADVEFLEVSCYEGSVLVTYAEGADTLKPGQQFRLDDRRQTERNTIRETGPSWVDGISRYQKAPLARVFSDLERQFGIRVVMGQAIARQPYTGGFAHDDLPTAVRNICEPMGLDCVLDEKELRVTPQ